MKLQSEVLDPRRATPRIPPAVPGALGGGGSGEGQPGVVLTFYGKNMSRHAPESDEQVYVSRLYFS